MKLKIILPILGLFGAIVAAVVFIASTDGGKGSNPTPSQIEKPVGRVEVGSAAPNFTLENSLKVVGKKLSQVKIVIVGAGAAGIAIAKFLKPEKLIMFDSQGAIYKGRKNLNFAKVEVANLPYYQQFKGDLPQALIGADVFVGVSGSGKLESHWIAKMNKNPIIFALSNPNPEILPDKAKKAGAAVVATGRSDFPNQVNNALVFPGFFAGMLKGKVRKVTEKMKRQAAKALSFQVKKPTSDKILPATLDKKVAQIIAQSVTKVTNKQ